MVGWLIWILSCPSRAGLGFCLILTSDTAWVKGLVTNTPILAVFFFFLSTRSSILNDKVTQGVSFHQYMNFVNLLELISCVFAPGPSSFLISHICLLALPWTCQVYSNFYPQRAVWLPPLEILTLLKCHIFRKPFLDCAETHTHTAAHHMLSSFLASSFSVSLTVTLNYRLLCLFAYSLSVQL